jgi:hypothetical protein
VFSLDLLRSTPSQKGLDNEIHPLVCSENLLAAARNLAHRTMPNTMPGFCIEALRQVATLQSDFAANPFSGSNM